MTDYEKFLQAFRLQRATGEDVLWILTGIALIVFFLYLRKRWERIMARWRQRREIYRAFLTICEDHGLEKDEKELLENHWKNSPEGWDLRILKSSEFFDQFARRTIIWAAEAEVPRLNALLTRLREKLGFRPPSRGIPLNSTRELPVGQRLYLVFSNNLFLEGTIAEIDETRMLIWLSAGAPENLIIPSGVPLRIHFNRSGDARYSGSCIIVKISSEFEGLFLTLNHCEDLKRNQRRQDFRIEENRIVHVWVLQLLDEFAGEYLRILSDITPEKAIIEDISGGGASLIMERELPVHQSVYVHLDPFGNSGLPLVKGTVVRAQRRSGSNRWAVSIRFDDLRPSERQKLIGYVFAQEREALQPH